MFVIFSQTSLQKCSKPLLYFVCKNIDIIMTLRIRSQIIPRNASIIFTNQQECSTGEERVKQALFREEIFMPYEGREEICQLFVDHFFDFLEKHKQIEEPVNVDLSVVSLEELKIIIATFKEKNGLNPKKVEPLPVIPEELTKSTSKNKIVSTIFEEFFDIVHEKKNGAWDYEFKMMQLQCKRRQYFYNHLIRTSVMVKSPTVRKKSTYFFFETKTLLIKVSFNYRNSTREVFRTIDDFIFLHDSLKKIYPHSYLPQLDITMQEIKNIDSETNNIQISKKCAAFVSFIMRDDELFDNQLTSKFVTEEIQANYARHKTENDSISVDSISEFVNSTGRLQVNVSKEGEQAKRCIAAISEVFQEKFAQISSVTKAICEHAQPLPKLIHEFSTLIDEIISIADSQRANSYFSLANFINLLISYKKMGEITGQSLHSCESVLSNIRQSFLLKTVTTWSQFNIYRQNMMHMSSIYQQKRKIFLQGLSKELNQPIDVLDLTSNEQECSWIQNETAWYGHLNASLIKTFSNFLKQEEKVLHIALKDALAILNERHERQKKNLNFITRLISQP